MKCFLKKILLFLLPIVVLLCLFEAMLRTIPNDYSYKRERMIKDAKTIEVFILGSSHTIYGLDPAFISPHVFNAAYSSQTVDIDYKLLKKYGRNMENLRAVVIPISYFSLYSRIQDGVERWRLKNYIIYHGFFFDLVSLSPQNYFELCNGTIISNLKRFFSYYKRKENAIGISESGFKPRDIVVDETILEETGKTAAERHKNKNTKNAPIDYNGEILAGIIAWCAARNIQVFFFTPPAYKTYINHLDETQLHETIAYMERLARQYDNVTYDNFLFEYQDTPEYFYDADHLNSMGARVFSEQIREILRQRGILDNAD